MLEVEREDADVLLAEVAQLLTPPAAAWGRRQDYVRLHESLDGGSVPDDLLPALEQVLGVVLPSGRVRREHGPHEEQRLIRLHQRTPAGVQTRDHLKRVNAALSGLCGHQIERLLFAPEGPGAFRLDIRTDRCRLAITVGPNGIVVHQLEVSV
jgi:hypothetical protein